MFKDTKATEERCAECGSRRRKAAGFCEVTSPYNLSIYRPRHTWRTERRHEKEISLPF